MLIPSAGRLVEITGLRVSAADGTRLLDGAQLTLDAGERIAVTGRSGAGKTTLGLALLGELAPGTRLVSGQLLVAGRQPLLMAGRALREFRRGVVAYLPQDPATTLTPTMRVGAQIAETAAGPDAVASGLAALGLPSDREFLRRYPHQLSGGQRQRVALARTMVRRPALVVLDEPTSGLDADSRDVVLDEISRLSRRFGFALLLITHDPEAARVLTDRTLRLEHGRTTEYRLSSGNAGPPVPAKDRAVPSSPVLAVHRLRVGHRQQRKDEITGPDGMSLELGAGELVALLGASGVGKTTLVRAIAGRHTAWAGQVRVEGTPIPLALRARAARTRAALQLVPQDASGSLSPHRSVGATAADNLVRLCGVDRAEARRRVRDMFDELALAPELATHRPHELSGGQCRRVALAVALLVEPKIVICDEINADLDTETEHLVWQVLATRRRAGLAVLAVTHRLDALHAQLDRVVTLAAGQLVESGPEALAVGRVDGRQPTTDEVRS